MSTKTIVLYARTDIVGSKVEREIEVDAEDWAEMDDAERDKMMFDAMFDDSLVDWGYHEK